MIKVDKKINKIITKPNNKKKKRKHAFTLIELLAVIIILGVLMIIAVPSVSKYISDSRKNGYVSTAKSIASGVRNLIYSGDLDITDKDTTYYVNGECIKTDNGYRSPYGDFEKAYVVVTVSYDNYEYFWTSVDETGVGVKSLVNVNKLDTDNIETDISSSDITTNRGIDDRSKIVVIDSNCQKGPSSLSSISIDGETGERIMPICMKATTRHTSICTRNDELGCNNATETNGTITYGTIPSGSSKAGDAYDCDVNNDGVYDSETERFYYVKSEGKNSVLVHYINISDQTMYAYDSARKNILGPRTGYQYLPSTSDWSNPKIIAPGTRNITNEIGGNETSGGTIGSFTYTDKAARFLTAQEVNSACGITIGSSVVGELNNCTWLLENVGYYERGSGTRSYGFYLETPKSNSNYEVWCVDGRSRFVYKGASNSSTYCGVRPAITVKTSNIEK